MAGYAEATDDAPGQSVYFEHGQHATSICGAMGSAAAAARLFGLDADRLCPRDGRRGVDGVGDHRGQPHRWHRQAPPLRLGRPGRGDRGEPDPPRHHGGPHGPRGPLRPVPGLLRDEWRSGPVTDGLGEKWEMATVFYKPYPANHFTHAASTRRSRCRARGIGPTDVARAHLMVPTPTVRTIGEPLDAKQTTRHRVPGAVLGTVRRRGGAVAEGPVWDSGWGTSATGGRTTRTCAT